MKNFPLGVAIAAALSCIAVTASAQTVIRFNQVLPANHWAMARIVTPWAKQVEEATQGRVKVQMTGASLGGFGQSMDLTGQGVVDANFGTYGVLGGQFTLARMTEVPMFEASDPLPVSVAYWRAYEQHFAAAKEHEKAGTKLLAHWVSGANHLYTREKKISTIADLRGLKFGTSVEPMDRMLRQLGAVGLVVGTEQFFDIVSKGIADGVAAANTGPNATRTEGLYKHQLLLGGSPYFTGFYMVMNQAKFAGLPAADKTAIESVSGEKLVRMAGAVFSELDKADLAARKAAGKTEVAEASPAFMKEMAEKTAFVTDEWLASAKKLGYDGAAAQAQWRRDAAALGKSGL